MKTKNTLSSDDAWIHPEKLAESENNHYQISPEESQSNGDFGSYKLLNSGAENHDVEKHNIVGVYAKATADMVKCISKNPNPKTIADMGCGAAFFTIEIQNNFPQAKVYGYDVSRDAIEYAKKIDQRITFEDKAIGRDSTYGTKFDLILAKEFYPFTRTNSIEFQMDYLLNFEENLNAGGEVLIFLLHTDKCILNSYDEIKTKLGQKNINISKVYCPHEKIFNSFKSFKLSQLITWTFKTLLNRKHSYILKITK